MATFKVMTYNVHSCVGTDGKLAPERIAEVIARASMAGLRPATVLPKTRVNSLLGSLSGNIEPPSVEERARFDLEQLSDGCAEHIGATHAALSRTQVDERADPPRIGESFALFSDAIGSAERLIYAETQYFT
ncbi:MAG TPA: hypothetical protein VHW01_24220, partial [Polyangiaceae bacterium]|nr:hypothetical protein [Polyangiaceae bacterium]